MLVHISILNNLGIFHKKGTETKENDENFSYLPYSMLYISDSSVKITRLWGLLGSRFISQVELIFGKAWDTSYA